MKAVRLFTVMLLTAPWACTGPPSGLAQPDVSAAQDLSADVESSDLSPAPDTTRTWPARWHVSNGFLRDAQGRAVIMRGANLSGRHKSSPYFDFHLQADYDRLWDQWGFNGVRFLILWDAIEPTKGGYDSKYLDEVAKRMDWAEKAGILVVLDMHQDLFGVGFGGDGAPRWACDESKYKAHKPKSPWFLNYSSQPVMDCFDRLYTNAELRQHFAEAWRRVALRLKGYSNVVGFDVMNEPHWGSYSIYDFEKDRLQPFYDGVVHAVRSAAPHWVAFLEPSSGRYFASGISFTPFSYGDVVYAPHSYDANAEAGQGFNPANRKFVVDRLKTFAQDAKKLNAALWLGEYGGNPDHKGITEYMDAQYDGAAAAGGSTMYWTYTRDKGYGMLNPDGTERKALMDVLVRPYPRRVAGDAVTYAFEEKSRTFTLQYQPVLSITAPTEIALPARVYPTGYTVSCGGCKSVQLSGSLQILTPPAARPAVVTITPKS